MNRQYQRTTRTDHLQTVGEVFRVPMVLGVATIIGLVSALLGDDIWDVLSWLAMLAPLTAVVLAWRRRG